MPCSAHSLPSERVVILGAGPCGLACADELKRLGHLLLEAASVPGGLGSSVVDPAGFTWDLGGHVVFSHFGEFDRLLAELFTAGELLHHDRSSYIRFRDRWVPCPFQQHLHHLPAEDAEACVHDLLLACHLVATGPLAPGRACASPRTRGRADRCTRDALLPARQPRPRGRRCARSAPLPGRAVRRRPPGRARAVRHQCGRLRGGRVLTACPAIRRPPSGSPGRLPTLFQLRSCAAGGVDERQSPARQGRTLISFPPLPGAGRRAFTAGPVASPDAGSRPAPPSQ